MTESAIAQRDAMRLYVDQVSPHLRSNAPPQTLRQVRAACAAQLEGAQSMLHNRCLQFHALRVELARDKCLLAPFAHKFFCRCYGCAVLREFLTDCAKSVGVLDVHVGELDALEKNLAGLLGGEEEQKESMEE